MLITLPADAYGGLAPTSVLDLEPLLAFTRQCRPDAVSLPVPLGADDQPNGAALLAMRERLATEGLQTFACPFKVAADAPVTDEGWHMAALFECRALAAALGEAGLELLLLSWDAAPEAGDAALVSFLERLTEEARRTGGQVALRLSSTSRLEAVLRQFEPELLGAFLPLPEVAPPNIPLLASDPRLRVAAVCQAHSLQEDDPAVVGRLLSGLRSSGFSGPLFLDAETSAAAYAYAAGLLRGLDSSVAE